MLLLRSLLNAAAICAIAQALVKILEMALDDKQKQDFQHATERLALKLIDLDPIRHYQRLCERKTQHRWFSVVVVFPIGLTFVMMLIDYGFSIRAVVRNEGDLKSWITFLSALVLLYLPFRLVLWWFGRSRNVLVMLAKAVPMWLMIGGFAIFGDRLSFEWTESYWFMVFFNVFFYSSAIIALLYVAQGLVWIFRHVMWRIATDSKGAWSASLFLVASILGLAAVFIPKS